MTTDQEQFKMRCSSSSHPPPLAGPQNSSSSSSSSAPGTQFEADPIEQQRELICRHPLYPLLSAIFEKCELAIQSDATSATAAPIFCPEPLANASSDSSFDRDIAQFVRQLDCNGSVNIFTGNQEVDSLMIQAIQILRFHLLEIEKVHELCQNFCSRYIACLKGKMPAELVAESEGLPLPSASLLPPPQPQQPQQPQLPQAFGRDSAAASTSGLSSSPQSDATAAAASGSSFQMPHQEQIQFQYSQFCTAYQHHAAAINSQKLLAAPQLLLPPQPPPLPQPPPPPLMLPLAPMSGSACSLDNVSETGGGFERESPGIADEDDFDEPASSLSGADSQAGGVGKQQQQQQLKRPKQKKRRGIFPKTATNVMRAWLFQHLNHPYPSEEQKKQLSTEAVLTILQVNNWFINARRRIVQPIIDQSNQPETDGYHEDVAYTYASATDIQRQQQHLHRAHQIAFQQTQIGFPIAPPTAVAAAAAVSYPNSHQHFPALILAPHEQQQQQQQQLCAYDSALPAQQIRMPRDISDPQST